MGQKTPPGRTKDGTGRSPHRELTDESLRGERDQADRALATRQEAIEAEADAVVERARDSADAVLVAARVRADAAADPQLAPPTGGPTVSAERAVEDDVLRRERAAADEALHRERLQRARALAQLLPLERAKTDQHLLTERSRSDAALSHRDGFLGIVSHDLRDLLGGIVMTAGALASSAAAHRERDDTRTHTERIQRFAARMNRLIGDLVDVAAIDAGKLAVTPTRGDARVIVTEAVDAFRDTAAATGLALEIDAGDQPLLGEFDHQRMLQVFANVIGNAIKFTEPGGRIIVGAAPQGDALLFSVRDTGVGIPEDRLEAIFQRFWQVGENDQRGLGLGLYISKSLIEAHGGRIWAHSTAGHGTTISFTVPTRRG